MHLENDKAFWLSRNNLINLLSVAEFQEKISIINIAKSEKLKVFKVLESLISHNENIIILESEDYSMYISLPFPFDIYFKNLNLIQIVYLKIFYSLFFLIFTFF